MHVHAIHALHILLTCGELAKIVLLDSNVGLPVREPLQVGSGCITLHLMHV